MAGELLPETRDRILEGALEALGRVGFRHLTMGDVSERAGLSRGTVYRYFPSKDDLLAVLAEYEQDRFAIGLRRAVEARVESGQLLSIEVVAGYIIDYLRRHPALTLLTETEPAFVLGFFRRQLPEFRRICEDLVAPTLASAPVVRSGVVSISELSEVLLHVVLSVFLVAGEKPDDVRGSLAGALDSIVKLVGGRGH
jgi:TetR/AcrR family transcriptional regulator, repressor for uid operon